MKLAKSLLLGTVAGLAATVGAQAADLPSKKAAPVEYVRVCSAYGAGFFYIPGTDTCLRVLGRVRAEYQYTQNRRRADAVTGLRTIARVGLDARTQTAYGTLRAYAQFYVARRTGNLLSGTTVRRGIGFNGIYGAQTEVMADAAFVQFAGITAGRAGSFFDFSAGAVGWFGPVGSGVNLTDVLAYTATFGGGFSATLAVENMTERRNVVTGFVQTAVLPDIVAALRVDQGWGSAQLSAALHEIGSVTGPAQNVSTKYGWAVQGGLKLNLPMLAAGDALYLSAGYASGALSYTGSSQFGQTAGTSGVSARMNNLTFSDAIQYAIGGVNRMALVNSWQVSGEFLHYWTPTIRQGLWLGYHKVDVPSVITTNFAAVGNAALRDWSYWQVGTNVIWSPVAGLDIGLEVLYHKATVSGTRQIDLTGTSLRRLKSDDQIVGRVRIQRDF